MFTIEKYGKERLKKSVFGHFFQRGETFCAYNALKIITIYFDAFFYPYILRTTEVSATEVLDKIPENLKKQFLSVVKSICDAHILVPRSYNELGYLDEVKKIAFKGPRIRVLVLHLTDYCNLRCRYCFIEGNIPESYKRQNMRQEVIERAIDKFSQVVKGRNLPKPPSIVFYGGEPLANWKVMKHGLEYLRQKQEVKSLLKRIDKILITNGTLITPKVAKELKQHDVMVSVSIDGSREIHDFNRVFRSGKGSFRKTMAGLCILKEAGINPTVSCVLSKESLDHASDIIHWLLDELGIKALGFNHVSIVPSISGYDPVYEVNFAEALLRVQDIIQEEYPDVYERRMNHKINAFLDRKILKADCTGCGEQMSVSPDGQIGICQGYMGSRKTFGGSVFDSKYDPSIDPVFIEWSQRSPLNMPQCYQCPALATCGGGCPRNADFINGSIWEVDSAFCHFAKKAQEWMIWKKKRNISEKVEVLSGYTPYWGISSKELKNWKWEVVVFLHSYCDGTCAHCWSSQTFLCQAMPVEWHKAFWQHIDPTRVEEIRLTGGEPFLYRNIGEVVRIIRSRLGPEIPIRIFTGGRGIISLKSGKEGIKEGIEETVQKILQIGVVSTNVEIHLSADEHHAGSLYRASKGIKLRPTSREDILRMNQLGIPFLQIQVRNFLAACEILVADNKRFGGGKIKLHVEINRLKYHREEIFPWFDDATWKNKVVSSEGLIKSGAAKNIGSATELLPSSQLSPFLFPGAEFYQSPRTKKAQKYQNPENQSEVYLDIVRVGGLEPQSSAGGILSTESFAEVLLTAPISSLVKLASSLISNGCLIEQRHPFCFKDLNWTVF